MRNSFFKTVIGVALALLNRFQVFIRFRSSRNDREIFGIWNIFEFVKDKHWVTIISDPLQSRMSLFCWCWSHSKIEFKLGSSVVGWHLWTPHFSRFLFRLSNDFVHSK